MQIEFSSEFNPQKLLEIKDPGRCAIEASNDDGLYFYLVVLAVRGYAYIMTSGPSVPDVNELPNGYKCELKITQYKPAKMKNLIFVWLNGAKGKNKPISEAKLVEIDYALKNFRNVGEAVLGDPDLSDRVYSDISCEEEEFDDDF